MRHFSLLIIITLIILLGPLGCKNVNLSDQLEQVNTVHSNATEKENKIVLLFPHGAPETAVTHAAALKFKELVEQDSNGEILVDIYPSDTLGNAAEVGKALRIGTVQVSAGTINSRTSPALAIFNIPNLFPDEKTAIKRLAAGPLREAVNNEFETRGLKLLGVVPDSFRVTSSKKPIRTLEDFKGLKIRILDNPYQFEYWKALGAEPISLPFNEVYTALQLDLVEAQENPMATIVGSKLYEQQKYIIITNHFMHYNALFMSKAFFDNLAAEHQTLIKEVMPQVMEFSIKYSTKAEIEARKQIIKAGLEIINLSAETQEEIRKKTVPVLDSLFESKASDEIVDIMSAIED